MQAQRHNAIATPEYASGTDTRQLDYALLIEQIDAILPQTQCRQCGYEGCKPYATAIAHGEARINQCPPGGEAGIRALSSLLNSPYLPLNTQHGVTKPKAVAFIDEARCIGCTLCIKACPVDAILGASKQMHTVIAQECTGCELCLAPCPVDCIDMQPLQLGSAQTRAAHGVMSKAEADRARQRYQHRQLRLARDKRERQPLLSKPQTPSRDTSEPVSNAETIKKAAIAAAMARVKAQREKVSQKP